jgi:four helix bundle protein
MRCEERREAGARSDRSFEALACYQLSLKLLGAAYDLASKLPDFEKYNLADQLRRAAVSVVLNIAEGYGRYHYLDKIRFFYIARGSLDELLSAFIACKEVHYTDSEQIVWVRSVHEEAHRSLNGFIGFIRKEAAGKEVFGDKYIREPETPYDWSGLNA